MSKNKYFINLLKIPNYLKYWLLKDKNKLPTEYQKLKYIETTGTQYINTNFIPNNNTKIEVTYMLTNVLTQIIFGSRAEADSSRAYNGIFVTHRSSTAKVAWGKGLNSNIDIQNYNDINVKYKVFFDKNNIYFNNNLVHNFLDVIWDGNYSIFAGCINTKGRAEFYAKCKYYNIKIWNENTLERDLVPCYRKSDNVVGLYDLVNDIFYTNQGTGEFIYG